MLKHYVPVLSILQALTHQNYSHFTSFLRSRSGTDNLSPFLLFLGAVDVAIIILRPTVVIDFADPLWRSEGEEQEERGET